MATTRRKLLQNFTQQLAFYRNLTRPSGTFVHKQYNNIVAKKERLVSENIPKTYIMLESYMPLDFYLGDVSRLRGVLLACTVYFIYYLIQVVKRPILACADGPFKEFLNKNIPTLDIKYWPTFWCVESRVQTVFAVILRSQIAPPVNYRREILTLSDGGIVALDWLEDGCDENAPCIIILPGITGASQADYIKCLVLAANNVGLRVVVFQNRGLGGVELKTPRFYCASKCDDLSEVVRHVRKTLPNVKLGATGISMGGLILGNYLARRSEEAHQHLTAAKIISVPWDVHKATASVEKPIFNFLLGRHLAKTLSHNVITQMQQHKEVFKDVMSDVDTERMLSCKTLREFDDLFTSKHFGYAHVNDYYTDATLHNKLHHIKVPLLCLSAADDPFQPLEGIPIKSAEECSHVAIIVTARGGHIGFLEGWWPWNKEQYMGRIFVEYFTKVFDDDNGEFEKARAQMHASFLEKRTTLKLSELTE